MGKDGEENPIIAIFPLDHKKKIILRTKTAHKIQNLIAEYNQKILRNIITFL